MIKGDINSRIEKCDCMLNSLRWGQFWHFGYNPSIYLNTFITLLKDQFDKQTVTVIHFVTFPLDIFIDIDRYKPKIVGLLLH